MNMIRFLFRRTAGACLPALAVAAGLAGVVHHARAAEACGGRDLRPLIAADPSLSDALAADVAAMPFGDGKFFKVSKPGLAPSWLYGTIHHADPRVTAMAPAVLAALDGAGSVALELAESEQLDNPDTLKPVQSHVLAAMVARPSERAEALLSPADLRILEDAFAAHSIPSAAARTFRPSFMTLALAMPPCAQAQLKSGKAVDAMIAQRARERGHAPVGLETLAAQFDAVAAIPAQDQGAVLQALLRSLPFEDDVFETTTRLYAEGHAGWLLAWSRRGTILPGVEAPAPPGFFEVMLDRRNRAMRDAALPLLAGGGVFIAVGAAHLPGKDGLANLVRQAGYTVERAD